MIRLRVPNKDGWKMICCSDNADILIGQTMAPQPICSPAPILGQQANETPMPPKSNARMEVALCHQREQHTPTAPRGREVLIEVVLARGQYDLGLHDICQVDELTMPCTSSACQLQCRTQSACDGGHRGRKLSNPLPSTVLKPPLFYRYLKR